MGSEREEAERGRENRGRAWGAGVSWERSQTRPPSPPPPQGPCWLHSSGELALPSLESSGAPLHPFPLGKLFEGLQKALPGPASRLNEGVWGTKGPFSPEPRVGRPGSLAGRSCRAGVLALHTRWFCSLSSHLRAARPVCFVGERESERVQCWTLTLQQGAGCICRHLPGLALSFPCGGQIWESQGTLYQCSCFSPHSPSHRGMSALRSICVSEP